MNTIYQNASGKAAWPLIPFLILCYFVAYLDRVNAGFAPLTMNNELALTTEMFGFGVGVFMAAIPLSSVIGGPMSGLVLDTFNGVMGLSGWQWLFIIEGVPSVFVGLWVLSYLTDKPREAAWLEPDERIALQARLDDERKGREAIRKYTLGEALTNPRVLGLGVVLFGIVS